MNEPKTYYRRHALHYRDGKEYDLLTYCIMPNHVHMVCPVGRDLSRHATDFDTVDYSGRAKARPTIITGAERHDFQPFFDGFESDK